MTVAAQFNDNGTTTTLNLTLGGGISFAPVQAGQFPAGNCNSNVTANVSISDSSGSLTSCSVSGSICGQNLSGNCAN
jgi:hypothetical protein